MFVFVVVARFPGTVGAVSLPAAGSGAVTLFFWTFTHRSKVEFRPLCSTCTSSFLSGRSQHFPNMKKKSLEDCKNVNKANEKRVKFWIFHTPALLCYFVYIRFMISQFRFQKNYPKPLYWLQPGFCLHYSDLRPKFATKLRHVERSEMILRRWSR